MTQQASNIVLTDPKPLKADDRCPTCRAGADRRVPSCGFGIPHDVCGQCGHEFPTDSSDD